MGFIATSAIALRVSLEQRGTRPVVVVKRTRFPWVEAAKPTDAAKSATGGLNMIAVMIRATSFGCRWIWPKARNTGRLWN